MSKKSINKKTKKRGRAPILIIVLTAILAILLFLILEHLV